MYFAVPFISSYSLKFQLITLFVLLFISYLHRGTRLLLACLATLYIAFLCVIPLIRWTYYLFKAIAMFGFYVHHFWMGLGFLVIGVEWVMDNGTTYATCVLEKLENLSRRRAQREEDQQGQDQWQEQWQEQEQWREGEQDKRRKKGRKRGGARY